MSEPLHDIITRLFAAYEAKDIPAALDLFDDDAVLLDPRNTEPRIQGKDAIGRALEQDFAAMNKLGFTILHFFEAVGHEKAAAEVDSDHVLENGDVMNFSQVFVIDAREGRISRLQVYLPFGPPPR